MSQVYDNWERLVEATLKRELWRQLALCDSMESSFSSIPSDIGFVSSPDQDVAGSSRRISISEETEGLGDGKTSAVIFTLHDLRNATENFNPKNLIGEGGTWKLYKGHLRNKNMDVAVKLFRENREFLVEVLMLNILRHPNIANFIGYCSDGEHRMTLHEYVPNGSLDDRLFDLGKDKDTLDWNTRLRIAAGAAKALEYLHERANPHVIHRNFKTSNILLDANFNPKLSSFGLAKLGPTEGRTHISTRVMGTFGYCAPEYAATGRLSVKCDVYSFGVVLMEILTGKRVIDSTRGSEWQNLIAWARPLFKDSSKFPLMADPLLQGRYPLKAFTQALAVAAMCLQEQDLIRPSMRDVVTALDYLSEISATNTNSAEEDGGQE